jgi:hypothetical protein
MQHVLEITRFPKGPVLKPINWVRSLNKLLKRWMIPSRTVVLVYLWLVERERERERELDLLLSHHFLTQDANRFLPVEQKLAVPLRVSGLYRNSAFDRERTRSEGLDRCDDLRDGQTHEHTRDDK